MYLKTYIINLERSVKRRETIQNQLVRFPFILPEFVRAVDGRKMSETEKSERFDADFFRRRYARQVLPGEIGCTLSHQVCYRRLLESDEPYALILEDDVIISENLTLFSEHVSQVMATDTPRIILLSGWYWYKGSTAFYPGYKLADIYDAFLAYAYVLNRSAARLLMNAYPGIVADDWRYVLKKGVHVLAVLPHIIEAADNDQHPSTISHSQWKWDWKQWYRVVQIYVHEAILRLFKCVGKFEDFQVRHDKGNEGE